MPATPDILSRMSPIGFGAFKIGRNEQIKYAGAYALPTDEQTEALLHGVLDLGITYIDTAPAYGISEERLGRGLAGCSGRCLLSTKVGERFEEGRSIYDFSRAAVLVSLDASRRRLQRDVLELVFVHAHRDEPAILERTDVVQTLLDEKRAGRIRAVGWSGYAESAFRAVLPWADAIMVEYHPKDRSLEALMTEAAERGVAVVVKKGLASGTLNAGESIRFVLSNSAVTSLLVGSLQLSHVRENVRIARQVRGWSVRPPGAGM